MRAIILAAALALSGCATMSSDEGPGRAESLARGREIAETVCSTCHAVGRTGESPLAPAPPFRQLSRKYNVEDLQEALAEGISVGHPAMPHFEFTPSDVTAMVGYLQSIQERPRAAR
jgi:mono/diheme cytochrome c family protein